MIIIRDCIPAVENLDLLALFESHFLLLQYFAEVDHAFVGPSLYLLLVPFDLRIVKSVYNICYCSKYNSIIQYNVSI